METRSAASLRSSVSCSRLSCRYRIVKLKAIIAEVQQGCDTERAAMFLIPMLPAGQRSPLSLTRMTLRAPAPAPRSSTQKPALCALVPTARRSLLHGLQQFGSWRKESESESTHLEQGGQEALICGEPCEMRQRLSKGEGP